MLERVPAFIREDMTALAKAIRSDLTKVTILFIIALFLGLYYCPGFYASDDIEYFHSAHQISTGGRVAPGLGHMRLGVTLPAAVAYSLSGRSVFWTSFSFTLFHLGLIIVAYILGFIAHGRRVGMVASATITFLPVCYIYAPALLPDLPSTLWMSVLIVLIFYGYRESKALQPHPQCSRALYLLAGFTIGLAYSAKVTGLLLVIPAAAVIIAGDVKNVKRWIQHGVFFAGGIVLFFLVEYLIFFSINGEHTFRLSLVWSSSSQELYQKRMAAQGIYPWERISYAVKALRRIMPTSAPLLLVGVFCYPFIKKRAWPLLVFFWWLVLYLTLGSTNFQHYLPPSIQTRYYAVATVPAVVMFAYCVVRLHGVLKDGLEWRGRSMSAVLGVGLCAVAAYIVVSEVGRNRFYAGNQYRAEHVRSFTNAIERVSAEYPRTPIVLGPYYSGRMPTLFRSKKWPRRLSRRLYLYRDLRSRRKKVKAPFILILSIREGNKKPLGKIELLLKKRALSMKAVGVVIPGKARRIARVLPSLRRYSRRRHATLLYMVTKKK